MVSRRTDANRSSASSRRLLSRRRLPKSGGTPQKDHLDSIISLEIGTRKHPPRENIQISKPRL